MSELVQADGDFDLVADIIEGLEGLEKLDYVPKLPEEPCPPVYALFAVQRSETKPGDLNTAIFRVQDQLEIDHCKCWLESQGYPVVLWTPPLLFGEAVRYLTALYGCTLNRPVRNGRTYRPVRNGRTRERPVRMTHIPAETNKDFLSVCLITYRWTDGQ